MSQGSRGIQSLDIALQILDALGRLPGPATLSELGTATGMPPAKLHRYLASFVNAGYVEQAQRSGRYDLGSAALRLGVGAMARSDIINDTASGLPALTAETGATALLAVWGSQGATIVRWERSETFIVSTLGLGTILPLLQSATGQVFLAFAPPSQTSAILEREQLNGSSGDADAIRRAVRKARLARTDGRFIPGLSAASAPVLNWQGEIEAAVTLVGTDPAMLADTSPVITALDRFCRNHSADA